RSLLTSRLRSHPTLPASPTRRSSDLMTGFTRIVIVLGLLRTAIGTRSAPPNQVLLGLALFLTFFVMAPTVHKAYQSAWVPLSQEDRKSTRLNSSHVSISYAVFCLKKQ